jgi:hypothetical protein
MRYQVAVPVSAVVTLEYVYEIEAENEDEARRLVNTDEALELPDEDFFLVDNEKVLEIHSSEQLYGTEKMRVARVG